jgi:hypothetical protein
MRSISHCGWFVPGRVYVTWRFHARDSGAPLWPLIRSFSFVVVEPHAETSKLLPIEPPDSMACFFADFASGRPSHMGSGGSSSSAGWTERLNLVGCFAWLTFAGLSLSTSLRQKRDWNRFPSVPLSSDRLGREICRKFQNTSSTPPSVEKWRCACGTPITKAARGHGERMGYASPGTPTATIKAGGCRSEA